MISPKPYGMSKPSVRRGFRENARETGRLSTPFHSRGRSRAAVRAEKADFRGMIQNFWVSTTAKRLQNRWKRWRTHTRQHAHHRYSTGRTGKKTTKRSVKRRCPQQKTAVCGKIHGKNRAIGGNIHGTAQCYPQNHPQST